MAAVSSDPSQRFYFWYSWTHFLANRHQICNFSVRLVLALWSSLGCFNSIMYFVYRDVSDKRVCFEIDRQFRTVLKYRTQVSAPIGSGKVLLLFLLPQMRLAKCHQTVPYNRHTFSHPPPQQPRETIQSP